MQISAHTHFLFTSNFPLTSGDCICFITWQNPTGTCSIEITHPQLPSGFFVPLCAFVPFTSCFLCLSLIPIFISIVSMIKKNRTKTTATGQILWGKWKRNKNPFSPSSLHIYAPLPSSSLISPSYSSNILQYFTTCNQMQSWRGLLLALCGAPSPPFSYLLLLPPQSHSSKSGSKTFNTETGSSVSFLPSFPFLPFSLLPFLHPSQLPSSSSCHSYQVYYMQLHVPSLSPVSLPCLFLTLIPCSHSFTHRKTKM